MDFKEILDELHDSMIELTEEFPLLILINRKDGDTRSNKIYRASTFEFDETCFEFDRGNCTNLVRKTDCKVLIKRT